MKRLITLAIAIAVAIFLLLKFVFPAFADTIQVPAPDTNDVPSLTLVWNPIANPLVAGFRIYWGTGSGPRTNIVDCHLTTGLKFYGMADGTNYTFTQTTYSAAGAESAQSGLLNWTNYRVEWVMTVLTLSSNGVSVLSITNPLGDNFFCLSNNSVVALNEPTQNYLGAGPKKFVKIKLTPKFYYKTTP